MLLSQLGKHWFDFGESRVHSRNTATGFVFLYHFKVTIEVLQLLCKVVQGIRCVVVFSHPFIMKESLRASAASFKRVSIMRLTWTNGSSACNLTAT